MQEIQPCFFFDLHNLHLCKNTTHLFVVKSNLFQATVHTHGHQVGDQALIKITERILKTRSLSTVPHQEGNPLQLPTASIGIAVCPEEANDINCLVLLADQRLYKAKSRGRNQIKPVINPWKIELSG